MRTSVLAERAFRHLSSPATASALSHVIGASPASVRKVLARMEAARMVTRSPGQGDDRRASIFTRAPRASFSHVVLKHHVVPRRQSASDYLANVQRAFYAVPLGEERAATVSEIRPLCGARTRDVALRALNRLVTARMVLRTGGRSAHKFYRLAGAVFSPEALGAAPTVRMVVSPWFFDNAGNPTRSVWAVESRRPQEFVTLRKGGGFPPGMKRAG
jgi:hypothetical protein